MMQGSSREFRPDLAREFEYLLGHMPRVDRETFQGLLIEDSEASERVLEAENELFDAYLRGDLPGEWRPAFESRLLSTERGRDKLVAARKLSQKVGRSRRSLWWSSAIAAGIALIAGFWPSISGIRSGGGGGEADRSSKSAPSVVAQVIPQRLDLKAITRGAASDRPKFPRDPAATHFVLVLPEPGATSVELSRLGAGEDVVIWKSSSPPPFQVPADLLPEGAYLVSSFANGTISNYYEFEIVRK